MAKKPGINSVVIFLNRQLSKFIYYKVRHCKAGRVANPA